MLDAQTDSEEVDGAIDDALEEARDWPEVRVPLLYARAVRAIYTRGEVAAAVDRVEEEAIREGMSAMRAAAILLRIHELTDVGLGATSFEDLAEVRVLLEDESQPVRDRLSGLVSLAGTHSRLRLFSHEDEALAEALRVMKGMEYPDEGRAVCLCNQALSKFWQVLDAFEAERHEIAGLAMEFTDSLIESIRWDVIPDVWQVLLLAKQAIAHAVLDDEPLSPEVAAGFSLDGEPFAEARVFLQLVTPISSWTSEPDLTAVTQPRATIAQLLLARARDRAGQTGPAGDAYRTYGRLLAEESWKNREAASAALSSRIEARRLRDEHASLRAEAMTDELTGIRNRRGLALAVEQMQGRPATVLTIDLDRFKRVNDRFGHQVGDIVLQKVADAVSDAVRSELGTDGLGPEDAAEGAAVGRLGGDEFFVLIPGDDRDRGDQLANLIHAQLALVDWSAIIGEWEQRATIGVACGPCNDALIGLADREMYDRKPRRVSR
ncbi:MAG: GGDEF domain-containing protein [Actinomycetota bacterium]